MLATVFLLTNVVVTGTQARGISAPVFPEDVVPDQYIVRLRTDYHCEFPDHIKRIQLPTEAEDTIDFLDEHPWLYVVTLRDHSLTNSILADECVKNVWHDALLHNANDEPDDDEQGPSPPSGKRRGSESPSESSKRLRITTAGSSTQGGKPESLDKRQVDSRLPPEDSETYDYEREFQLNAPWQLRMMTTVGREGERDTISRTRHPELGYAHFANSGKGARIFLFGYLDKGINKNSEMSQRFEILGTYSDLAGKHTSRDTYRNEYAYRASGLDNPGLQARTIMEVGLAAGPDYGVAKAAKVSLIEASTASELLRSLQNIANWHDIERAPTVRDKQYSGSVISLNLTPWEPDLILEVEKAIKHADDLGVLVVAPAGDRGRRIGDNAAHSRGEIKDGYCGLSRCSQGQQLTKEEYHARRVRSMSLDYPCKFARALCVGAVDIDYNKATFSSYGEALNIWAPGVDLDVGSDSVDPLAEDLRELNSGTNLASSLVAGWAAAILSYERFQRGRTGTRISTFTLRHYIVQNSHRNRLHEVDPYSRNLLINTGINGYWRTAEPYQSLLELPNVDLDLMLNTYLQTFDPWAKNMFEQDLHASNPQDPGRVPHLQCRLPNQGSTIFYDGARALYMRLDWERGHSNSYDAEERSITFLHNVRQRTINYTAPIPCIREYCVYLSHGDNLPGLEPNRAAAATDYRIYDASVLANALLTLIHRCSTKGASHSPRRVGGRIIVSDHTDGASGSSDNITLYLRSRLPGYKDKTDWLEAMKNRIPASQQGWTDEARYTYMVNKYWDTYDEAHALWGNSDWAPKDINWSLP